MLATVDTNEGERSRVRAAAMRKRHIEKPDGPRNVIPASSHRRLCIRVETRAKRLAAEQVLKQQDLLY
jgi:hypothetical protein